MRIAPAIITFLIVLFQSQYSLAGSIAMPMIPPIDDPMPATPIPTPTPVKTYSATDETVASIGLRLEFGDIVETKAVATVRHTRTDTDNDVSGALAEIVVPFKEDGFGASAFSIKGIFGDVDVQGIAGLGFDFGKGKALLGLGAQTNYVDGGINIYEDGQLSPYVGASSYDGPSERRVNN